MTLNFGLLGILFIVVIVAVTLAYHRRQVVEARRAFFGMNSINFAVICSVALLGLGLLSIVTLNNYFFADSHVYRNTDHHTLRLDGIELRNAPTTFVLAANSPRAFFDDESMCGSAVIDDVSADSVRLRLDNFCRPLFINHYNADGRCTGRTLLGGQSLLQFADGDTLFLRLSNADVYGFYVNIVDADSVDYHLILPDGSDHITDEHRFLTQGLPMSMLTQGIYSDAANFSDLHLVRTTMHMQVRKGRRLSTYRNVGYALEVRGQAPASRREHHFTEGRIGNGAWQSLRSVGREVVSLPLGAVFQIGYDGAATRAAAFSRAADGDGRLSLLFKMPCYRYLSLPPEQDECNASVRTSLHLENEELSALPDEIILFDLFSHDDNLNTMRPVTIGYRGGSTTEPLTVSYSHDGGQTLRSATAGDRLLTPSPIGNPSISWLLSIEDLRSTAPYSPFGIKLRIALFTLLLALLVLWRGATGMTTPAAARRNLFTTTEFAAYAVTIYLVSLRWLLLWRTAVFPPVDDISYYEFNGLFRNAANGRWLTLMMAAMVVVVATAKKFSTKALYHSYMAYVPFVQSLCTKLKHYRYSTVGTPLLTVAILFVLELTLLRPSPLLRIALPVFCYLALTVFIDKRIAPTSRFSLSDRDERQSFMLKHTALRLFAAHVGTALLFAAMLLVVDSGYGILFLTFSLFWALWLMQQHVGYYMRGEHRRVVVILLLLVVTGLLIYQYKDIIGFLDHGTTLQVAGVTAAAGAVVALVSCWIMKLRRPRTVVLLVVGTALVFTLGGWGFRGYLKYGGQHTAQRIAVHFSSPDDVMEKISDDATEHRYLQAALNHAVIGVYTDCGRSVRLTGADGHGYFRLQPHSKVGALWNAQLTDIALVRYVISEHSALLPLLLVSLFVVMLLAGARQPLSHRWARSLLIQIPLLLFVHSLLIWMATTQRFIFLGQDFPMVSLNSRLTLLYYFGLVTTWVLVSVYERASLHSVLDADDNMLWRFTMPRTDGRHAVVALALCIVGAALSPRGTTSNQFELTRLMNRFALRLDQVNERLAAYQDSVSISMQHDLSADMNRFSSTAGIDALLADFPFGQRLWHNFVSRDSRNNTSHLLLHAHLDRDGRVVLALVNKFTIPLLPRTAARRWHGNITSADGDYLARSIMVNGRPAFVYPQGKALFTMRHVADELRHQQTAAAGSDGADSPADDIRLTLSASLTDALYSHLRHATATRSSVIVASGDGAVMAMADFDARYTIGANDEKRISSIADSLYMYGLIGSATERRAFGNKNLLHIENGPGSTVKPLLWTAVASRTSLPWRNMSIAPYEGLIESRDPAHFSITSFGGIPLLNAHPLVTLKSDENNGDGVDLYSFITRSSNVYSAALAYIGSFTQGELSSSRFLRTGDDADGSTLLVRIGAGDIADTLNFRRRFPVIRMGRDTVAFNRRPLSDDQPSSLLETAMRQMFLNDDDADTYYTNTLSTTADMSRRSNGYAYAETSHLNSRQGDSEALFAENAIRSTAIGAQQVWEVTPWKMAEAYGRMATLNAGYRLSLTPQDAAYRRFEPLSQGFIDARRLMMRSMSDVLTGGTAHSLGSLLHVFPMATPLQPYASNVVGRYYVYAKTGTISTRGNDDSHRLAIVIADRDLALTPADALAGVRFVVVFFTCNDRAQWSTYAAAIKTIMASEEFRSYMNNNNSNDRR